MRRYTYITNYRKMDFINLIGFYIALLATLLYTLVNDLYMHSIILGVAFSVYSMHVFKVLPTVVHLFSDKKIEVNTAGKIIDVVVGLGFIGYMIYIWSTL